MVAFISLNSIIPKIIECVNFEEYLKFKGYSIKKKSIKNFKCFSKIFDSFEDVIFLSKIDNKEIYYSLGEMDKGNVIDFVKNRIEIYNEYKTFEPEKDHLIEACKELIAYINENGEKENKISINSSKEELHSLIKYGFTKFHNANSTVFDKNYYKHLAINEKILKNTIFEGKIYSTIGLSLNDVLYEETVNASFPIYDINNNECGLYNSNYLELENKKKKEISFYVPGSNKSGIWLSNKPNHHKNNKIKFTVVNSPIEALAHFSYLKEERQYCSIFNPDETTYDIIKSQLTKQNSFLYLSLGVSIENFIIEIKMLLSFIDADIKFVKVTHENITLIISKNEEQYFEKFLKKIKTINNNNVSKSIQTLGDGAKEHLQSSLILAAADNQKNLTIIIPKNYKTLYQFENLLIKTFNSKYDIIIEKPRYIDWRTQNKQSTNTTSFEEVIEMKEIFILNN